MNRIVFNSASFSPGDVVMFSGRGGIFTAASSPIIGIPSGGTDEAHRVYYRGEAGYRPTVDGMNAVATCLDVNSRNHVEIENFFLTRPTDDGLQIRGASTGVVVRGVTATYAGNQNFQMEDTASAEYYDIKGANAADDGFSMHGSTTAVVHGGWFENNVQGVNFVENANFTGFDIVIIGCTQQSLWPANTLLGSRTLHIERFFIDGSASAANMVCDIHSGTTATLRYGIFKNVATDALFALAVRASTTVTAENLVFYDSDGLGKAFFFAAPVTLHNSIIQGFNTALFNQGGSIVDSNNCLFGNATTYVGAPAPSLAASVPADPMFRDPAANDFRLKARSPCIDAGLNLGSGRDYAGRKTPQGRGVDIGALEVDRGGWASWSRVARKK